MGYIGNLLTPLPSSSTLFGNIYGLTLSNNVSDAVNDIDVAAGAAADSTNIDMMVLAASITKRLDAAWAVGTNQGGLDTGSIADTTYHMFLIKRSDTGVTDVLFSASATAPTMPANYTYKRRIGSIMRIAGSIKAFKQVGDRFAWDVGVNDVAGLNNPGTAAVTRTLTVPTGIVVDAWFSDIENNQSNNRYILWTSLDQADTVPSVTAYTMFPQLSAGNLTAGVEIYLKTNTSGQVRYRSSASGASDNTSVVTKGWIDTRGRHA